MLTTASSVEVAFQQARMLHLGSPGRGRTCKQCCIAMSRHLTLHACSRSFGRNGTMMWKYT
jgi:hypothetical protein